MSNKLEWNRNTILKALIDGKDLELKSVNQGWVDFSHCGVLSVLSDDSCDDFGLLRRVSR